MSYASWRRGDGRREQKTRRHRLGDCHIGGGSMPARPGRPVCSGRHRGPALTGPAPRPSCRPRHMAPPQQLATHLVAPQRVEADGLLQPRLAAQARAQRHRLRGRGEPAARARGPVGGGVSGSGPAVRVQLQAAAAAVQGPAAAVSSTQDLAGTAHSLGQRGSDEPLLKQRHPCIVLRLQAGECGAAVRVFEPAAGSRRQVRHAPPRPSRTRAGRAAQSQPPRWPA